MAGVLYLTRLVLVLIAARILPNRSVISPKQVSIPFFISVKQDSILDILLSNEKIGGKATSSVYLVGKSSVWWLVTKAWVSKAMDSLMLLANNMLVSLKAWLPTLMLVDYLCFCLLVVERTIRFNVIDIKDAVVVVNEIFESTSTLVIDLSFNPNSIIFYK